MPQGHTRPIRYGESDRTGQFSLPDRPSMEEFLNYLRNDR